MEFADVEAAKKAVEIKERMLDNSKVSKASKASKARTRGHPVKEVKCGWRGVVELKERMRDNAYGKSVKEAVKK